MQLEAEDIAEMQMLASRYCFTVDWGTVDEVADLFHPDAKLRPYFESDEVYTGTTAIKRWFEGYFARVRAPRWFVRHKPFAASVALSADGPCGSMYFDSESVAKDSDVVSTGVGRYDFRFARHGGDWRFSELAVVVYYVRTTQGFAAGRGTTVPVVLEAGGRVGAGPR